MRAFGSDMVPFDAALEAVRGHGHRLGIESVGLAAASNRVLAHDLIARRSLPPFDNSQMDGFAVRASSLRAASAQAPVQLKVVGPVYAGPARSNLLQAGEAFRIMTGAPLPNGADAVVMQEDVNWDDHHASFRKPTVLGTYVRPAGADIISGQLALRAGSRLGSSELALAASLGCATLKVRRAPRVALLATGDELVPVGSRDASRIVDSNTVALRVRLRELGCDVESFGIVGDEPAKLRRALKLALDADLTITMAGASVGDRDFVKPELKSLGAKFRFERVAMRPGKPVGFAKLGRTLIFTLPGNPVSARVTFETLVVPAIDALRGRTEPRFRWVARLTEGISKPPGLTYFPRVRLIHRGLDVWAEPVAKQNSGYLTSLASATALAVIPTVGPSLRRGARVELVPL